MTTHWVKVDLGLSFEQIRIVSGNMFESVQRSTDFELKISLCILIILYMVGADYSGGHNFNAGLMQW